MSVVVFGPSGAGKSFGAKQVAKALNEHNQKRPIEDLTFNLSQYQTSDELAAAFHLVRDLVLKGRIPLVLFDEFDTALGEQKLAWLRYFLAPMQDGQFLDRGALHPIGQAIFLFAGGTCDTYCEFSAHIDMTDAEFKAAKGPDFLSRLRGALDIPSLNFLAPRGPRTAKDEEQALGTNKFDPYTLVDNYPCRAAIPLRRAGVLAFQLGKKAGSLKGGSGTFRVRPEVLLALLHLPEFQHGNRAFEALLDMSRLHGAHTYTPSLLPPVVNTLLHAKPAHVDQLVATEYPFPEADLDAIAKAVHEAYLAERKRARKFKPKKKSHQPWRRLSDFYRNRNRESAREIPDKLRAVGHWTNLRVFTNEPRHLLRSLEPSAADVIFGQRLGCLAVDNAMAGYNDFMVSQWMTEFVLVPLELVVLGRKRVPPDGIFWRSVLASTGQPSNLNRLEAVLEKLKRGKQNEAQALLNELFQEGFEPCHTYCHLARLCLMNNRLITAREFIDRAWNSHAEARPSILARLLWFQLLCAILPEQESDLALTAALPDSVLISSRTVLLLGRLKTLLQDERAFEKWRMQHVLEHLKPCLSTESCAFLTVLAAALSDREKMTDLEGVSFWREAKPLPVD